jgi:YidC/Oxa1 family membrane protein insertase
MQPKNSLWNFLLFFVLSASVMIGWVVLQNRLQPPRKDPLEAARAQRAAEEARQWSDVVARTVGSAATPGVPGLGNAAQAYVDTKVADWLAERSYNLPVIAQQQPKPEPPKERPAVVQQNAKHEEIQLGNDESNLKVVLTSRGAGVQSVMLNQFRAATAEGQPAAGDAREELVPAELNREDPSNLLMAFANPDDAAPQPELAALEWTLESKHLDDVNKHWDVTFVADVPGQDVRILKTYSLGQDDYHLGLRVEIQRRGHSKEPVKFRYQLTGAHGLPIEGQWYTSIFRNALIGQRDERGNFWRNYQDSRTIGSTKPAPNQDPGGERIGKGQDGVIQYAGVAVQYFASAVVVDDQQPKQDFVDWARPTVVGPLDTKRPYLDDITVKLTSEPMELKADAPPVVHKYLLYNGPVKVRLLGDMGSGSQAVPPSLVSRYLNDLHLDTLTDYQSPGALGKFSGAIGWSYLLIRVTNLMHGILGWMHSLVPNYGICIILLTLLVRGLMHPVSRKQAKTSIRMQAVMPELKQLQEKHKGDRQAMGMAQMELYRRHGINPLGSCWVVLLQMPIFMGLYYALQESIHFRLASFGWIRNLAAPDMLVWWGQNIPWISNPEHMGGFLYLGPYFNLLPVIAVALMIVQQKFLMPPPTDEATEMQQKMMKYMMIFFGLMFYKVAAGLCLYFIVSSLWGLAERKMLPKAKPATAAVASGPAPTGKGNAGPGRGGSSGRGARNRSKPNGPKNGDGNGTLHKVRDMWDELLKQAKKK